MTQIGDICSAKERGFNNYHRYIWLACKDCGKERWVGLKNGLPGAERCPVCSLKKGRPNQIKSRKKQIGNKHPGWKNGRRKTPEGYIRIYIPIGDFFYPMASKHNNDCFEHRLVMAKYLNRCLLSWEVVHHKNGVRSDNRIENLELMTDVKHHAVDTTLKATISRLTKRIEILEARITQLEAENILLRNDNVSVHLKKNSWSKTASRKR